MPPMEETAFKQSTGPTEAGAEAMEPPAKRHKSKIKACDACRAKKAKCDMGLPACQVCERRGTECNYSTRGRPGLRPGFGKDLEQRLGRIEDSLNEVRALVRSNASTQSTTTTSATAAAAAPVQETIYSLPPQGGPSSISPAHQTAASCIEADTLLNASPIDLQGSTAQLDMPEGLPPRHVLLQLSALYFEFAHPWTNIYSQTDMEADIASLPDKNLLLSLHALTVCAFKYWTDSDPDPQSRDLYVENARERLIIAAMDQVSIPATQALAILTLDAVGRGPSSRTLNMLALLSTAVSALDLPQQIQHDSSVEERSRIPRIVNNAVPGSEEGQAPKDNIWSASNTFWMVYVLDRIIGVSHGIHCKIAPDLFSRRSLSDEDISTPTNRIKALINDVAQATGKTVLSEPWYRLIEMATLIGRMNEFLLKPVDLTDSIQCKDWKDQFRMLDAVLCSWRDLRLTTGSLPNPVSDPVQITVQAIYHTAMIRLHSVAAFPPRGSLIPASPFAQGRCHQAVQCIRDICQALAPSDISKLGPLFVFCVWVASRNTINLWTSGWEEHSWVVPAELTVLRDTLRALAIYWPCADNFSAMIDMVVESSERTMQSSMLAVFNDVSNTAYGLHNALGENLQHNKDMRAAAQMWDWFSMPGTDEVNPFSLPPN